MIINTNKASIADTLYRHGYYIVSQDKTGTTSGVSVNCVLSIIDTKSSVYSLDGLLNTLSSGVTKMLCVASGVYEENNELYTIFGISTGSQSSILRLLVYDSTGAVSEKDIPTQETLTVDYWCKFDTTKSYCQKIDLPS